MLSILWEQSDEQDHLEEDNKNNGQCDPSEPVTASALFFQLPCCRIDALDILVSQFSSSFENLSYQATKDNAHKHTLSLSLSLPPPLYFSLSDEQKGCYCTCWSFWIMTLAARDWVRSLFAMFIMSSAT